MVGRLGGWGSREEGSVLGSSMQHPPVMTERPPGAVQWLQTWRAVNLRLSLSFVQPARQALRTCFAGAAHPPSLCAYQAFLQAPNLLRRYNRAPPLLLA